MVLFDLGLEIRDSRRGTSEINAWDAASEAVERSRLPLFKNFKQIGSLKFQFIRRL